MSVLRLSMVYYVVLAMFSVPLKMYVCRDVFRSIVRCVFIMVYSELLQIWHILSNCQTCVCCVSSCCCQCWWTSSVILATKLPLTLHICSLDSVNSQPSCLFSLTVINWCTAHVMYSALRKNVWVWTLESEFVTWIKNFCSLAGWIFP